MSACAKGIFDGIDQPVDDRRDHGHPEHDIENEQENIAGNHFERMVKLAGERRHVLV
jgi:hypothetical protein